MCFCVREINTFSHMWVTEGFHRLLFHSVATHSGRSCMKSVAKNTSTGYIKVKLFSYPYIILTSKKIIILLIKLYRLHFHYPSPAPIDKYFVKHTKSFDLPLTSLFMN